MRLFGRNKDNEISIIKKDLENIRQNIKEINENCEKQVVELSNHIEEDDKKYEKRFVSLENKYKELNKKLDKIQNIIKLMNELNNDSSETQSSENDSKKTVKTESEKKEKKHLYTFNGEYTLYKKLSLNGNKIIGSRGAFKFTIEDIIDIKTNLREYYDKGIKAIVIGRKYGIARGTIQKVIYNIEEGAFDNIIEEYQNKGTHTKTDNHKINIGKSYRTPLHQTMDSEGHLYASTGKKMPYTIQDIIQLKTTVENSDGLSITNILEHFDYSYGTGCRVIWNIEEGNYDGLINDWENGVFSNDGNHSVDEKQKHFRSVPKSLHKPLSDNLTVLDGGEIVNNTWGRSLNYTIQDILELQQRIPDFNNYPTFEDLSYGLDMTISTVKTTVWRIEEGYFDDIIQEYLSRNYSYENNFNRLFIDGKNTGLSIDKCISIVECIINTDNKKDTVNKLIKMYPTVDSKYIRILSEEYANPNLSKVLKKEVKKVEKIDNPQKRREQGVYL